MNPQDLVKRYLPQVNIMQLATIDDGKPYLCTVHYYSDDDLNFYWISRSNRNHSQHIVKDPSVAAYVLVHENTQQENFVIGISIVGTAELFSSQASKSIREAFIKKHNKPSDYLDNVGSENDPEQFYRIKPSKIILFDNQNFPDEPRQEIKL